MQINKNLIKFQDIALTQLKVGENNQIASFFTLFEKIDEKAIINIEKDNFASTLGQISQPNKISAR